MEVLTYIYLVTLFVSFLSSLISFRLDLPFHLKLFSVLLGLTVLVELTANFWIVYLKGSNFWLYNAFTLLEFWVYGYFYYQLIRLRLLRRVIFLFLLIFPIFWAVTVFFLFGFNTWNSYVLIVGDFFSIVFALMYYYQVISNREVQPLRHLTEFWIATGMLIYYLGALPYFGMLNFLVELGKHNLVIRHVTTTLYYVLQVLDAFMYALFAYGYLCRTINTKKS